MKKIIVPTDFSENAQNALNYAVQLYKDETCVFYILHTYTPAIYNYDFQMSAGGFLGDIADVIKNNAIRNLNQIEKKIKKKFNNSKHMFESIAAFNILTDELKDFVDEHDIDLIIMGTKGASGVREVLFGSNTIHVIKKVKCPVLAIPDGYFFEEPKDILFTTDYNIDYEEKHLRALLSIATNFKAKVHVLNVSYGRDLNDDEKIKKEKLEKLLANVRQADHRVNNKEIPEAIDEFQKTSYVQLLMMINNKRSFFENLFFKPVISQIGFHLKTPLLVIPYKL